MANLRNCSREFLTEFIELYQRFPCLCRIKSKEYCDRDKKRTAYEKLIEKYKEIDVQANRETVVKKINEWNIDVFYFLREKLASNTVKSSTSSMAISQTTELIRCEHGAVWMLKTCNVLRLRKLKRSERRSV